jgi:glyoxylase-like metal-dependent hydrolase (beta-lactamase superfamily II)
MLVVRRAVVGPIAANAWLAACDRTGEAVLVDPGADLPRVLGMCEPEGYRIVRIFCTHGHADHVAAAEEARERTGAPLSLHASDEPWLLAFPQIAAAYGLEGRPPAIDRWHEHGEALRVGEQEARIIHTPGHSAGSCSLHFAEARVVFTGDTLFAGSVGRTDLPGGDLEALIGSIRDRLFSLGDEVRFHPGHGASGAIGEERRLNPFAGEPSRRGRFP